MRRSLKQIWSYKKCLAILFVDKKTGRVWYQSTNDLGFHFELKSSDAVDWYEIQKVIVNDNKDYVVVVEQDLLGDECEYNSVVEALREEFKKVD